MRSPVRRRPSPPKRPGLSPGFLTAASGLRAFLAIDAQGTIDTFNRPQPATAKLGDLDRCRGTLVVIGHRRWTTHGAPEDGRRPCGGPSWVRIPRSRRWPLACSPYSGSGLKASCRPHLSASVCATDARTGQAELPEVCRTDARAVSRSLRQLPSGRGEVQRSHGFVRESSLLLMRPPIRPIHPPTP